MTSHLSNKSERTGELFILSKLPIVGFFPIVLHYTTRIVPPILFATLSTVASALCIFLYLLFTRQLHKTLDKKPLPAILGVTLFIAIIPLTLIYIGASKTSSINTAILMQTEILFTFIICGLFFGEKITWQRVVGAILVVVGATTVLYRGNFSLNTGDLFIIAGTASFPIGNLFAKRALALTTPAVILFLRSAIGGAVLALMSILFEQYTLPVETYIKDNLGLILFTGIGIYCISKVLWYEGLKRIDITKAVSIGIAMPAFSILYAFFLLKEIPTVYQITGLAVIAIGLIILTRKKTETAVEVV